MTAPMFLFAAALAAEPEAPTPTSDGLTDVPSDADRAAQWSDALKHAVSQRWSVHVRAIDDDAMPRPDTYLTAVDATLTPEGRLVTVVVTQPSGAADLDAAVVSAFRDVALFEPPPPALLDATGTATARNLKFTLDLVHPELSFDHPPFPGIVSPPPPSVHALRTWARAEACSGARLQACPAALAFASALQKGRRPATALAVLRAVPDRSPTMLRVFAEASEAIGDTSDLADLALEVPADRVPEALRPTLDYHRMRALERAGRDYEARAAAKLIERSSPYYWRAQLVAGVLLARADKRKSAVRTLTEVVDGMGPEPKRGSAEAQLKHVAINNIARIYYGLHQFDEAKKHWSRVPDWAPEWDDAALGMAWTDMMFGARLPDSLTVLAKRGSAEAPLLRGLFLFNTCFYSDVPGELAQVEAWSPAVEVLDGALARGDVGFTRAYDALDLPKPLRRRIEADEVVRGLRAHLAQIKRERLWGDVAVLDGERERVTRRLDARLSGRARYEVGRLRELLFSAEVLAYDTAHDWGLQGDRRDCKAELTPDAAAMAEADARLEALIRHSSGQLQRQAQLRAADALVDPAARLAVYDNLAPFTGGDADRYLDRRADALDALGRRDEAYAERLRLVALSPKGTIGAEAWLLIGEARFEAGDFSGARAAYETVMQLATPSQERWAFANYKLAWCQWALGEREAALERMRAVVPELDPAMAEVATLELRKLEAAVRRGP